MTTTNNIQLTGEKETLFIPLVGKAWDYRSKNSILNDSTANEIVEKTGIGATKHKRTGNKIFAVRAKQYDQWTQYFIAKNKNGVIVHLGCGLDARIIRTKPPSSIKWFDVDYPEVISLRKKFYTEHKEYEMISSSITDSHWLAAIPADRPAFIMAEGVFEYLSEEAIKTLFDRLTTHFAHGQLAFDVMSHAAINSGNKKLKNTTGATSVLKWSVENIEEVDRLNPRLKRADVVPLFDSIFIKELPAGFRFLLKLLRFFPKLKKGMTLLRYEF